jgi:uncharacterized protein GlcG (DUF336 family)
VITAIILDLKVISFFARPGINMLSLSNAQRIINAAMRRAGQLNAGISVAVCDHRGRLIAMNRMDGSLGWETDRCSMGKAVAAAITGEPSDRLLQHLGTGAPPLDSCSSVVPPRGQRGGLPIIADGVLQGACGVSGATTEDQDEDCARAGIAVLEPALPTMASSPGTLSTRTGACLHAGH